MWGNAPDNRWSVEIDEHGSEGSSNYVPLCRCNGKRFGGTYLLGGGLPYAMQFGPDGSFIDNGLADSRGYFPDSNRLNGRVRPGQGTYQIQNYTILLRYTDGRMLRKPFLAPAVQAGDPVFDWIAFTQINNMYRRGFQPLGQARGQR
jgi:hypothetical protein